MTGAVSKEAEASSIVYARRAWALFSSLAPFVEVCGE